MPPLNLQVGFPRNFADLPREKPSGIKVVFGAEAIETSHGHLEVGWRETLARVLAEEVRELHRAEVQLAAVWACMAVAATNRVLQAVFEDFSHQCGQRVQRLKLTARLLGMSPEGGSCLAMEGLLLGVGEMIKENSPGHVRDASLIGAAQKIAYYLLTTYCCARDFAQLLGAEFAVHILHFSIDDEASASARLQNLAEFIEPNSADRRHQVLL